MKMREMESACREQFSLPRCGKLRGYLLNRNTVTILCRVECCIAEMSTRLSLNNETNICKQSQYLQDVHDLTYMERAIHSRTFCFVSSTPVAGVLLPVFLYIMAPPITHTVLLAHHRMSFANLAVYKFSKPSTGNDGHDVVPNDHVQTSGLPLTSSVAQISGTCDWTIMKNFPAHFVRIQGDMKNCGSNAYRNSGIIKDRLLSTFVRAHKYKGDRSILLGHCRQPF
jgi:hypothetical protein